MHRAGVSVAAVPLYRMFCQATGLGGSGYLASTAGLSDEQLERVERMRKVERRLLKINFNADTHSAMQWQFKPQQREIWVHPGETALAFYTATNATDRPIVGISTYNVVPYEAGLYFGKIQCFCFEEQVRLL